MATTTMVHVRVDDETKAQATEALAAMEESRAIIRAHRARYASATELFDGLENEASVVERSGGN